MIFGIVSGIIGLCLCTFVLAFKIPFAFLAYFASFPASFFFKNERIPPSLYQRLTITFIKAFQLYLPLWLLRRLVKLFTTSIFVSHKRWVKKLDASNEHDGWEGYLIDDDVQNSEVGEEVDMVILFAHGGGFVCGDALGPLDMFVDWIEAWKLRYGANTQIITIEYGLSPENSFPVARDTMLACYNWLVNEKNISPSKIVFSGDSVGGNLAVVSALLLVDQPHVYSIDPPAALVLLSPCLSGVPSKSFANNASYDTIALSWYRKCVDLYIGDSNLLPTCPMISPVFETEISGLPKVWACAGEYEVLLDDIRLFIENLNKNNVKAELEIEEANLHDYATYKALSRDNAYGRSIEKIGKFLYGERELA